MASAKKSKVTVSRPGSVPEGATWSDERGTWELAEVDAEGQKHGITRWYRADGSMCCRTPYTHGVSNGEFSRFHENGEPSRTGAFLLGRLEGTNVFTRSTQTTTEIFPHNFGSKVWRVEWDYKDDRPHEFRAYDREGHPCDTNGKRVKVKASALPASAAATEPASPQTPAHFRAPPRSEPVQSWTPPADLPIELRNGVWLTPALRRALSPRRGGIAVAVRPAPTIEEAWSALRRVVWEDDRLAIEQTRTKGETPSSTIWNLVTSTDAAERALGERVLDPSPRKGNFEEDAFLVSRTLKRYHGCLVGRHGSEGREHVADFLLASVGLEETISRLFTGMDDELPHANVGPFERVRDVLYGAPASTIDGVRKLVVECLAREKGDDDRTADLGWAASYILPIGPESGDVERELHERAMRYVKKFGSGCVHAAGLASGDLSTLTRYRAANGNNNGHEFFYPLDRMYLASILELEGSGAVETLAAMKPAYPWTSDVNQNMRWAFLLAHFDHDVAIARLLEEHKADVKFIWAASALAFAAKFQGERVRRVLGDGGAKEHALLARIEAGDVAEMPLPMRAFDASQPRGEPFDYLVPEAQHVPSRKPLIEIAPEVDWRDDEREAALQDGIDEREAWNGKPIHGPGIDLADAEAWMTHREKWKLPTTIQDAALAPSSLHPRLMAMGFSIQDYLARGALGGVALAGDVGVVPLIAAAASLNPSSEYGIQWSLPFGHVDLSPPILAAFAGKKNKALARSWLLRHPRHAIAGALTSVAAAGAEAKPSKETKEAATDAARALRYLDSKGHRATILELARSGPAGTEASAKSLLDEDPLAQPKAKLPKLPKFADPKKLPELLDAKGKPLDPKRVERLLVELAASNADEVHPGVLAIRSATKPASRSAFAWALLEAWLAVGAPPKEGWAMQALGFLGDDDAARKLTALAKDWPGQNAAARAQSALDALMNIGTEIALMNINLLAEKSKYPAFKLAAAERIRVVADARGMTSEELSDRLVPTLGLDDVATRTLVMGDRTFTIAFDEALRPVLKDDDGANHTKLPKPGKLTTSEDKAAAKEAAARFAALTKDARASASLHVARLERAMQSGRLIDADVFVSCFAQHPWMSHLARRLVWETSEGKTFRVTEDGSLADSSDRPLTLAKRASVKVAHPLAMSEADKHAWSALLADYEVLQPFPQLTRPTFVPTAAEAKADVLERFAGKKVPHGALRGLTSRGWNLAIDSCIQSVVKRVSPRLTAVLDFEPGWYPGDDGEDRDEQTLCSLRLVSEEPSRLGVLPPITFSELVHDLDRLVADTVDA